MSRTGLARPARCPGRWPGTGSASRVLAFVLAGVAPMTVAPG